MAKDNITYNPDAINPHIYLYTAISGRATQIQGLFFLK